MAAQAPLLRRGWTTGACAAPVARAVSAALPTGKFPGPMTGDEFLVRVGA